MADASKRIDLAAPLLSVRRHGGLGLGGVLRYGERCDDDTPGGVPFGWERRPGHPKGVGTTQSAPPLPVTDQEAAGRFSDVLSRPDSCYTVNCSDAAGATASASAAPSPRGSVMMDRFLLAAKEQCVFRKAAAAATKTCASHSLPRRLPVQHLPASHVQCNHVKDTDDNGEDDEWEVHSTAGFASKGRCGLLPARCAKSALLLLNPARSTMRRRRGAWHFLSDCGSGGRETNSLLPRIGQHPDHDDGTRSWEEVYISSLLRSDRGAVHPKASHLGWLLVLDRADGGAASPLPPPNPKCSRPPTAKANVGGKTLNAVGQGFPPPLPLLQERTVARRGNMVLALPSPKTPSESWLSRTLPSVSNRPPAASFMGIHVQQLRKQHAPSRWCSSDQAKRLSIMAPGHGRYEYMIHTSDTPC